MPGQARPSDVEIFGVDKQKLVAALEAAVNDGTITTDEMYDTITVIEKIGVQ